MKVKSFTWDNCPNFGSFAEPVLAWDEVHFINLGGKLTGMKDKETQQWKECQMPNVWLDSYLERWQNSVKTGRDMLYFNQNMLETEADVSTFVIVALHMPVLWILLSVILILDMGHIQDYTYEKQLRTLHKLWLLWTAGIIIYPSGVPSPSTIFAFSYLRIIYFLCHPN